jgi:hypothetical protein
VREGDYKLVEFFEDGGRMELYNLRDDPNPAYDPKAERPRGGQAGGRKPGDQPGRGGKGRAGNGPGASRRGTSTL